MDAIDIDAVIRLADSELTAGEELNRTERVQRITAWFEDAKVFVAAENPVALNGEEGDAMLHLLRYMDILKQWKLRANEPELIGAIHTLQGFIVQHMLARLNPEAWSDWYAEETDAG